MLCAISLSQIAPRLRVRYFSVYLVLAAISFGFEWLLQHPGTPFKALWLGLLICVSLLIAPCLWLCTLEVTAERRPSLSLLAPHHRLLILVGMLCSLPLIYSAHTGTAFANAVNPASKQQALFIHTSMIISIVVFCIQAPFFIGKSLQLLARHDNRVLQLFSNLEDQSIIALRLLLLVVCIKWLMILLRTLHCMLVGPAGGVELNLFMSLEIAATLWALFVVFRHNRLTSQQDNNFASLSNTVAQTDSPDKYTNSALDAPARQRILTKLQRLMNEDCIYQDSQLSLKHLSELTRESPHYLSQVINQDLGGNFYEWVNCHRIDAAKRALLEQPQLSILHISELVGFNSKSTFNAAFRRQLGITPSALRREGAQAGADRSSRTL